MNIEDWELIYIYCVCVCVCVGFFFSFFSPNVLLSLSLFHNELQECY